MARPSTSCRWKRAGCSGIRRSPARRRDARRKIFTSKIETLAKLHRYDPEKIGLGDFGKPGNYFARQVDRWTKQYRASETQHIPEVEKLIEWLPRTVPEQKRVSIVHGDYRLDNMIFHPTEPRVQAVLDWELSTLGDPMADFTYLLMQWTMPGLANADLAALNIPTMDEAAKIYCDATGETVPDLNWYFSYNLFRLAGITQGIAGRIRDGTAASAKAMEFGQAHRAAVAGVVGLRAKGGGEVVLACPGRECERIASRCVAEPGPRFSYSSQITGTPAHAAHRLRRDDACAASGARDLKSASPHRASTPSARRRPGSPGR